MTVTQFDFSLRGLPGRVSVELVPDDDPARWGYRLLASTGPLERFLGFPVCMARVTYPGEGYAAVFGWVQLVQSSDSAGDPSVFELDPVKVYERIPTPFAWFGVAPVLFDAPSRESRYPLRWRARSWLCAIPDAVISQEVAPVCGFEWGFDCDGNVITIDPPTELRAANWKEHLSVLRRECPSWTFHKLAVPTK